MKCPKCGRENVPGTPFCADCGKNLFASDVSSAGAPDPAETTRSSEQAPSASSTPSEPAPQAESASVVVQPAEIFVQGIAPEPEEAPTDAVVDVVTTPVITDGAIYIAPVTETTAEAPSDGASAKAEPVAVGSAPKTVHASEPEPIPDPEPAAKFEHAFDAAPEGEVVEAEVAKAEADAASTPVPEVVEAAEVAETGVPAAAEAAPAVEGAAPAEVSTVAAEVAAETESATSASVTAPTAPVSEPASQAAPVPPSAPVPPPPAPGVAPAVPAAASATSASEQPGAGASGTGAAPTAASTSAEQAPGAEPGCAPGPDPRFAPFASTPIVPPNPARAYCTYAQPGEALYQKGCLAAAWDDITHSKGWFGRMMLLGLVSCVPILNFFVTGYAMRWSRELFLGKVAEMPKRIFGNRMFVNGFFAFVIQLVIGIVVGMCGFILEFIPLMGTLAYFALTILVIPFEYLAIMRAAVADRLGAGFDVSQIWQTGKRNFGALCCATMVPSLIIGAILCAVAFALMLIMWIPIQGAVLSVASQGYGWGSASLFVGVLTAMLPLMLIIYVLTCFSSAFLVVFSLRATGHYVARYAQEWKNEQAVMSTAHINGV